VPSRARVDADLRLTTAASTTMRLKPPLQRAPQNNLIVTNSVVGILDKQSGHCGRRGSAGFIDCARLKALSPISSLVAAGLGSAILPAHAQVNVTQFHNHSSRDGLYIDSAFTQSAAANLTRDLNFDGTIDGDVYAQPLYIDDGPNGRPTIIAVTESRLTPWMAPSSGSGTWASRYR